MNTGILKSYLSATMILLLLSSLAIGRGREEFRGEDRESSGRRDEGESRGREREFSGRGAEGESRSGERGFSGRNGEGAYRADDRGFFGRGGEGESRGGDGQIPRRGGEGNFRRGDEGGMNRDWENRSPWSNPSHSNAYERPYPSIDSGEGSHTGPAPEPWRHPAPNPDPGPGPSPSPWPHPAPNPTPGPGPDPHPWPHPGPHPNPGPNPNPGPHPGPGPDPHHWPHPDPHPNPGPNPNPGPGPCPNPSWYHGNWPNNGNGGWNNGWNSAPAAWNAGFATGVAAATPWSWGYWPSNNPYCPAPVVVGDTTIDYSQPIVSAAPVTVNQSVTQSDAGPANTNQPTPKAQAMDQLDAARTAFTQGDYTGALSKCDQAISLLPNSTAAHEFRGLALFALHRYKEAAAPVYSVLSIGPGWDWATLSSFYPRPEVYSEQLRALEQYMAANPNVAEARFLLGYHYMTGGHNDAAAEQFKAAAQLNPQDHLSTQLMKAPAPAVVPAPPAPGAATAPASAAPTKPIDASMLTGVWTTTRADGTTITLSLTPDAKYTWKLAQKGKPQEFSGGYAVADNLLILREGNSPAMVGQVTLLSDNRFNFKLAGDNPSDPGLTFGK